jgi:phytanoyl-CoA hydroxylase
VQLGKEELILDTVTPIGTELHVPETRAEDAPYFDAQDELGDICDFYARHGYVVVRGLVPRALCERVRAVFDSDVRRSRVPVLRQHNMHYERHAFDADGFLTNPIFNVQDLGSGALDGFRRAALDVVTHRGAADAVSALLGGARVKLVQSMFFEAPAGTWAHQDSYYWDSAAALGGCVAGWFALEDIDAGAGRFYVCPGSHREKLLLPNQGAYNFATGHDAYRRAMLETIRAHGLNFAAPFLAAGDVLFWNSLTVHGSLPASRAGVSRASLTAHYLQVGDAMLQFHSRIRKQRTMVHNGMVVGLLHDQGRLGNRLLRGAAFCFPAWYWTARRLAMRGVIATRALRPA